MRQTVRTCCWPSNCLRTVMTALAICAATASADDAQSAKDLARRAEEARLAGDEYLALQLYRGSISVYESIPGTEWEQGISLMNCGEILLTWERYDEATQYTHRALTMFRTVKGSERMQAGCLLHLGIILNDTNRHDEAIAVLQRSAELLDGIPDAVRENGACSMSIGTALAMTGLYRESLAHYEKALRLFESSDALSLESATCMANIALTQEGMGAIEESLATLSRVLERFTAIPGAQRERVTCYLNMGVLLTELRRFDEAIQILLIALQSCSSVPSAEVMEGACLTAWAEALRKQGKTDEAIRIFLDAQRRAPGIPCSRGLGLAYQERNQPGDGERAWEAFQDAMMVAEAPLFQTQATESEMARFNENSNVYRDYVAFLSHIKVTPGKSAKDGGSDPPAAGGSDTIRNLAMQIADRGKGRTLEKALRQKATLQSARPETKLLAEDQELSRRISKLSSLREPLPEADEQRKKLTEEIDALQQRRNRIEAEIKKTVLGDYIAPEFDTPIRMAKELEPDRAVLQYSLGEYDSWLLIMTREGVTAHQLDANSSALPELLPRQEATVAQLAEAWKNRPDKIGLDGLVRLARVRAEDAGKRASERSNFVDAAQEQVILERLAAVVLPDTVLAELRAKGIRRLLVIPDGSLHYVPFAMLRLKDDKKDGTHYIVEEFASSYVLAMTTLDTIRKQKLDREKKRPLGRRTLLAFANPAYGSETTPSLPVSVAKDDMVTRLRSFRDDYYKGGGLKLTSLPETEREAVSIASLFAPPQELRELSTDVPDGDAVVFTSNAASEDAVKRLFAVTAGASANVSLAPRWKYVVFSTHGFADTHNGMLSCLALSSPGADSEDDGFLQAQEVMNLELDTDVVMLSACQTGLGRLRGGEGLVGLSAAFFYAGTESVCASLWQVPSGPTTQLVPEFFKQLKEGKADRAEALRQAQLTVLREGKDTSGKPADYSSPFCWAAFVLMGEYK